MPPQEATAQQRSTLYDTARKLTLYSAWWELAKGAGSIVRVDVQRREDGAYDFSRGIDIVEGRYKDDRPALKRELESAAYRDWHGKGVPLVAGLPQGRPPVLPNEWRVYRLVTRPGGGVKGIMLKADTIDRMSFEIPLYQPFDADYHTEILDKLLSDARSRTPRGKPISTSDAKRLTDLIEYAIDEESLRDSGAD